MILCLKFIIIAHTIERIFIVPLPERFMQYAKLQLRAHRHAHAVRFKQIGLERTYGLLGERLGVWLRMAGHGYSAGRIIGLFHAPSVARECYQMMTT